MCYEEIMDAMEGDAKELSCNVIGFKLRGVSQNSGTPIEGIRAIISSG
jgi:hypothetical protein